MPIVRFLGICCHVDPRTSADPFKRRIVLPESRNHNHGAEAGPDDEHLPYLEIDEKSIARVDFADTPRFVVRKNVRYLIFELHGEEVILEDVDPSFPFHIHDSYTKAVPRLKNVCPELPANPDPAIFTSQPPASIVAAYFDITSGVLMAEDLEEKPTRFDPPRNQLVRRMARGTNLLVETTRSAPMITLRSFTTGRIRRIVLRTTAITITIGNQPVKGIKEDPNDLPVIDPRHHFGLYYQLTSTALAERPLPASDFAGGSGCDPTNWP